VSNYDFFDKRVEDYRDKNTKSGRPKNEALIARIDDIHLATVRSLFTDDVAFFPTASNPVWWEVWLRDGRLSNFQTVAGRLRAR
jgi:hypothetical protein